MPARVKFEFKGLDKYLEDLAAAGANVDQAVAEVLGDVAPFVENELRANLLKTKQPGEEWTGETEGNIQVSDVQQNGNFSFIEVSIAPTKEKKEIHKEWGTARQAAEPFFRPTFRSSSLKKRLKESMKQLLAKYGLQAS
jgi:HK97 gp10 family phage protein